MKKLVIVIHPDMANSTIGKTWLTELTAYRDRVTIHSLYAVYPDLQIDIKREQELLLAHDEIIFQFPVRWFSAPFFFKKWMDEVLELGWACGPGGDKIKGKKIRFAVSAGAAKESYTTFSPLEELLKPFYVSFQYCGCQMLPVHSFYGAAANPTHEEILLNAREYAALLS